MTFSSSQLPVLREPESHRRIPDHKLKIPKAQVSISPFQRDNISYDRRKLQITKAWNSFQAFEKNGAGEEIRTLDIDLGKVALYH